MIANVSGLAATAPAKTFVITGASSGFGRGVALRLGAQHANVVLAARRTALLEEVAKEIRSAGGSALVVPTDVSRPEAVEHLADAAVRRFGHIDVWINDAAVAAIGRFWEVPLRDHERIVDVNLKGVIYGSHVALRQFVRQGYGTLINLGSVESLVPVAYHNSYAATKGGIRNLDQAINQELRLAGLKNIHVVTIMPWAVDTPFWTHLANYTGHEPRMAALDGPEKVVDAIVRAVDHPREEIAVGWKAKGATISEHFAPHPTEGIAAGIQDKELGKAPPTAATGGNLHAPMSEGRDVEGGVRARMKAEDAQAKR
jgi:short-subunit dehydrogenase